MNAKTETAKHTPGPWETCSGMVQTTSGIPIAWMDRETGNGTLPVERDENAQLIAAAPELLEAAKGILNTVTWDSTKDAPMIQLHARAPEIRLLCQAIDKVEGRKGR